MPKRSPMTSSSPSHIPGIMIRVTASGTSRRRAIQSVVISAATVIFMTRTSSPNGSSARPSWLRRAGAASLPVTKRSRSCTPGGGLLRVLGEDELVRRALERAVVGREPEHGVLDPARDGEVLVGDPAGGVVLELDPELAPGDREVGVVIGRLADVADGVHRHQRARPAVGVVLAPQPAVLEVPAREAVLGDLRLDLLVAVGRFLFLCRHGRSPPLRHYITVPPLTLMACPVMKAAAGEASQTAAAATSAGVPQRFIGVDSATSRLNASSAPSPNAVSIQPGERMLTRTVGASARARLLLKLSTPPLTALKSSGFSPFMPNVTWSQLMLRIVPPRGCARMTSATAYEHAIVPLRSTASRRSSLRSHSHSAASPVRTSAPALLTQTSRPAGRSAAVRTSASQASVVPRSAWTAWPPMRSATSRAACSLCR